MTGGRTKFLIGSLIIVGVLAWLGVSGYQESKTYYVTIPELRALGDDASARRLRVAGEVIPGTIRRVEGKVLFQLHQGEEILPVIYLGREPLPDTLVDNAQAIVTGRLMADGTFTAQQVQAKCASKYEALPPAPPQAEPGAQPKTSQPATDTGNSDPARAADY